MAPPLVVFRISVVDRDSVNILAILSNIFTLLISLFPISKLITVIPIESSVLLSSVSTIQLPVTPLLALPILTILTIVLLIYRLRTAVVEY